ncbi:MAG: helix-turn-helix domain-containing protein [Oceanipulchritudo sp.]
MASSSKCLSIPPSCLTDGLIQLFKDLQDTLFWIKDPDLHIVAINPAFAERVNLPEADILGKTDADLYFPELARVFMADDRQVIETAQPIHRKFELLANRFGGVEWRSTTKLPLVDRSGKVVGTTGISRPLRTGADPLPAPYAAFAHIVEYAREHLGEGVDVPQIARHAGMSVATLTRRFRSHMRLSPGEFLAQLRISRACKLLADSPLNVLEIAIDCGYESPSAFSRAFRRQMKMSPSAYRRRG